MPSPQEGQAISPLSASPGVVSVGSAGLSLSAAESSRVAEIEDSPAGGVQWWAKISACGGHSMVALGTDHVPASSVRFERIVLSTLESGDSVRHSIIPFSHRYGAPDPRL